MNAEYSLAMQCSRRLELVEVTGEHEKSTTYILRSTYNQTTWSYIIAGVS